MFTSRKMFPRHNHPSNNNNHYINNNNARFDSSRTLSRSRSYFSRDTTDSDLEDNGRKQFRKTWIYAGIAVLYLLIIGIVVTVLVLAPRYPSYYYYPLPAPSIPSNEKTIDLDINRPGHEEIRTVLEVQIPPPGRPFLPSSRDPIFHDLDMDPRSALEIISDTKARSGFEINETEVAEENITSLSRINNKFLNLSNIEFIKDE